MGPFKALLLAAFLSISKAEANSDSTPARVLAKQTGAAQFEEERLETHPNCDEHKHHLKKRASDEDVDYEVYQGVVGRPGIDFPIYPRIPKTSFSCRSFGNGYFADMETDCQVFHICEEGRKISFLCPNGTIFQQSELTCDWWFKVNCLGSPGYYADSAEILNKQRVQRIRPSVPVQGFNIVGGGLNIKPRVTNQVPRSRQPLKPDRRFDSNEEQPSVETVDFEDISGEKQLKGEKTQIPASIDNNNNNDEIQNTAESGSFVDGRRRNSFGIEKPNAETVETKSAEARGRNNGRSSAYVDGRRGNANNNVEGSKNGNGSVKETGANAKRSGSRNGNGNNNSDNGSADSSSERSRGGYNYPKATTERAHDSKRGQQRYRDEGKPYPSSAESKEVNSESHESNKKPSLLDKPSSRQVNPAEVRAAKARSGSTSKAETDLDEPKYSTRFVEPRVQSTTPYHSAGTYSTARRLDTTHSTPFYTPTVPTVAKSKTTEGKGFYIKGAPVAGSNIVASTPNPNRYNVGTETPNGNRRRASLQESATTASIITTLRPLIIGLRHHDSSGERQKVDAPLQRSRKRLESASLIPTTTAPATTGPTYLPRNSGHPKAIKNAGGDDFLSAPQLSVEGSEAVQRNVQEMIKTINLLKNKFDDVDQSKFRGQAREGLDIPPSSGPDALVSLAKYFEGEQKAATASNLLSSSDSTGTNLSKQLNASAETADATTSATPGVSKKADNIRASLLSERTVNGYTNLFGLEGAAGRPTTDVNITPRDDSPTVTAVTSNGKFALFPQIGTTGATISVLASKPDSRKIAQVFSEAISSYLEDPKTFRAQLESVRPTEPTIVSGKPNFESITVTDRSLFQSGTGATYLPTQLPSATDAPVTASSIAAEINSNFDFSTQSNEIFSTTDVPETTTYRPRGGSGRRGHNLRKQLSAELTSPLADSNEHDEFLHGEHTQSFVMSRANSNAASAKLNAAQTTENPWNHISQTDFIDPLTINDGLMKDSRTTTTTAAAKETTTHTPATTLRGQLNVLSAEVKPPSARNIGSYVRVGSAEETTRHSAAAHEAPEFDTWQELFNTYNLPQESLPSSNGLQRIANKLFGGLNESEALHLKNVMQQAEHNRQVLSLLLLLIQTCDDQNGRALERSRKHLLNALIDMDSKSTQNSNGKSAHYKVDQLSDAAAAALVSSSGKALVPSQSVATTTLRSAETTLRQLSTTNYPSVGSTTMEASAAAASTTIGAVVTQSSGGIESTTKFEIRVEDPEEESTTAAVHGGGGSGGSGSIGNSSATSDERALELLKSLYSLASKFTSRR
ncbi:uncharacterized protein thw isoform X2 [Eurosta solidaginis]|uniref:uncharacterized protein thw isoform X2 n=1 Tax=Eurosta solidaginis TaxID=178769 RepID=UPI0035309AE3